MSTHISSMALRVLQVGVSMLMMIVIVIVLGTCSHQKEQEYSQPR